MSIAILVNKVKACGETVIVQYVIAKILGFFEATILHCSGYDEGIKWSCNDEQRGVAELSSCTWVENGGNKCW